MANCLICGEDWFIRYNRKNSYITCAKCRRHEKEIDYGLEDKCKPWTGDYDLDDNPMKNGKYHLPGERVCGHKDCVTVSHIVRVSPEPKVLTTEDLLTEQFSTFYRTGKRLTWTKLNATLEKERPINVLALS